MSLSSDELPFGAVLLRAVVAGLVAGVIVAGFHFIVTEPVIEQAITLEGQMSAHGPEAEPLVSRSAQQAGLFIGFLTYGIVWALFFGVAFYLLQRRLPASSVWAKALLLAVAAYWSVGAFPFLKYPANPPGVGDPDSITYRQGLYLGILLLSLAGTAVAMTVGRSVGERAHSTWQPWAAGLGVLAVLAGGIYLLMPANPDAVHMPPDLVGSFRVLSFLGTTLFWLVMGAAFVLMAARIRPSRVAQ